MIKQLNIERIESILKKKWKTISIKKITKFKRGHTKYPNFSLEIINPNKNIVLRCKAIKHLHIEAKIRRILKDSLIPIPELIIKRVEENILLNSTEKQSFSIIERIKGEHLDEIIPKLSIKEQKNIGKELGYYLAEIHKHTNRKFGKLIPDKHQFGNYSSYENYLKVIIKEITKTIVETGNEKELKDKFLTFIKENEALIKSVKIPRLIHYDIYPDNILIDENTKKINALIDWEGARYGDNEQEFIKLHWWIFPLSKHLEDACMKEYKKHKLLSKNFKKKLNFYETFFAVSYYTWGLILKKEDLIKQFKPIVKKKLL